MKGTFAAATLTAFIAFGAVLGTAARADDAKPDEQKPPAAWADTLTYGGQIDAGIVFNPDDPGSHRNFGHLFTDHSNTPVMNQLLLTVQRPLDPKAEGWDFGFKLQGMYGTDARFTHFLGEGDRALNGPYQLDIVEANVMIHAPGIGEGGLDLKIGQYPTPLGFETIDPINNPFYTHSYIFNYGIPLKHTGFYGTLHLTSVVDLWAGVDTGMQTTFGNPGDNNGAIAGLLGLGLNLNDGNLTILGLSHFGPENPRQAGENFNVNGTYRYENDIVVTWKVSDALTSVTELNYIHDDGPQASGYGLAQYVIYTINDNWSIAGRAEVWSDQKGFFVATVRGNEDFVNLESGKPISSPLGVIFGTPATYTGLTFGANWKPDVPDLFKGLVVRPEIRWDHSNTKAFNVDSNNVGHSNNQFTMAADIIIPF